MLLSPSLLPRRATPGQKVQETVGVCKAQLAHSKAPEVAAFTANPPSVIRNGYILISPSLLQVANARIQSLEATVEKLLSSESQLKRAALALEVERSALLQMVEELQSARPSPEPGSTEPTGD